MNPTDEKADFDRSAEPDAGRRAIRISIGIIIGGFVLVAIVLTSLGAFLVRSGDDKRIKTEGEAVAIATGLKRPSDGMTFGEFAQVRYGKEITCTGWIPGAIEFSADEPLGIRQSLWLVAVQYRGKVPSGCQGYEVGFKRAIATVDGKHVS